MADQQCCVRWNRHQSTLISVLDTLLKNEILVDCTLAAEGQYLKAHRVVLSACSPYFESLLGQHFAKHPILILKDVKFLELKSLMDYMYRGEVNISQDQLGPFLKAAESLQIKGLVENEQNMDASYNSTPEPVESPIPVIAQVSTAHRSSNDTSKSLGRKRKKVNGYSSTDEGTNLIISNSCDIPNQSQSIPKAIPMDANVSSTVTALTNSSSSTANNISIKPEQDRKGKRIKTSNKISSTLDPVVLIDEIFPVEPLLNPKYVYLPDIDTDVSVEDLTLDDDGDEGNDLSITSHPEVEPLETVSIQSGSIHSGTGEVFMGVQDGVSAQASSLDLFTDDNKLRCSCGKKYKLKQSLVRHQRNECGNK